MGKPDMSPQRTNPAVYNPRLQRCIIDSREFRIDNPGFIPIANHLQRFYIPLRQIAANQLPVLLIPMERMDAECIRYGVK